MGRCARPVVPGTPEQWAEVEGCRRLIDYFADLYHRRWSHVLEFEDLRVAGRIGALEAIQQHDNSLNPFQWSRFLAIKVRNRIRQHIETQAVPIRVPNKSMRDYVRRTRPRSRALAAADRLLDHRPTSRVDGVVDPRPSGADPVEVEDIRAALKTLPRGEREVIEACYGIGREPRPMAAIAAEEGVTPAAIWKRRESGLARLRHKLQSYS